METDKTEVPSVFISYSWDDDNHQKWVKSLADLLIENGIEAIIDQYDIAPGDRIPQFMEKAVTGADKVLIICTENYKKKADSRIGGVGYEEHIISYELMQGNERKFIPILRSGTDKTSIPKCLMAKKYFDYRNIDSLSYKDIEELVISGIYEQRIKPQLGHRPKEVKSYHKHDEEEVYILEIITDDVTAPRNDGTPGSALYAVPFRLSKRPSETWIRFFISEWNHPQTFTSMHRPGIASVSGNRIILDGTTLEEVQKYHKDTLLLCVKNANAREKQYRRSEEEAQERALLAEENRKRNVEKIASEIIF